MLQVQQSHAAAGAVATCNLYLYVAGRFTFWSLLLLFIIIFDSTARGRRRWRRWLCRSGRWYRKSSSNITLWLWSFMPLFIEIFMTIQHLWCDCGQFLLLLPVCPCPVSQRPALPRED